MELKEKCLVSQMENFNIFLLRMAIVPKKKIMGDLGIALGKSAKVIEEERINDELIEEISQEFP